MARKLYSWAALLGLVLIGSQCQTLTLDMRKSGTLPQTTIEGAYFQEVVDACTAVFKEEGYRYLRRRGSRFLYEKDGSAMDFLAWGGFSKNDKVVERLSVTIRDLGSDSIEVECEPFVVRDPDEYMEEARRRNRFKSGKYQQMLATVRERCANGESGLEEWETWD